ncbi:GNAT family N-acetyltransferase [Candidatus Sumerlaeota bacterium]|nr:GNAT family N-acetyltransferase [Candidatus Sumerlaeota bacterium]
MDSQNAAAVSRLLAACYVFLAERQGFSDAQLRRLLNERAAENQIQKSSQEYERFVAVTGGEIAGFVGVEGNEVAELFVAPERQGQGVGRRLFHHAEWLISSRGHRTLTVHTTGYAIPFYLAMGMHIVAEMPCSYGPLEGWTLTYLEKALSEPAASDTE